MTEERVRIIQTDCLQGMRDLPGETVDILCTSPPYNRGTAYGVHDDAKEEADYAFWLVVRFAECLPVLKPSGHFFLNLGSPPSDPGFAWRIIGRAVPAELRLQNCIHWIKSWSEAPDRPAKGHAKPVSSPRYLTGCHEYVFHLTKTGALPIDKLALGVPFADEGNLKRGTRGKHGNRRDPGNVWLIPYDTISSRERDRPHPATFPEELVRRCLLLGGPLTPETRVLDPFAGLGTPLVVAKRLGCRALGFEIDPNYVAEAERRIAEVAGQATRVIG